MHAPFPLLSPLLWLRFLLSAAMVVWLPGHLVTGRWLKGMDAWTRGVLSISTGLILPFVYAAGPGRWGAPFTPLWYLIFVLSLGIVLGLWPAHRRAQRAWTTNLVSDGSSPRNWNATALAAIGAFGFSLLLLLAGTGKLPAPPHIHDASNHAWITLRIVQSGSLDWRELAHTTVGTLSLGYLPGLHAAAALIARLGGIAPYISIWMSAVFLAALVPMAWTLLWRAWRVPMFLVALAALFSAGNSLGPGGVLNWGGFGQVAGFFFVPAAMLAVRAPFALGRRDATAAIWAALTAGLVLGGLIHLHASEVLVVGLAAWIAGTTSMTGSTSAGEPASPTESASARGPASLTEPASPTESASPPGSASPTESPSLTESASPAGSDHRPRAAAPSEAKEPSAPEDRAPSSRLLPWIFLALLAGVLLICGNTLWGLMRDYPHAIATQPVETKTLGDALRRLWKAGGHGSLVRALVLAGWLLALSDRRWRRAAVAAGILGVWYLTLQTFSDPISRWLATPFYRQAPRILYLQLTFAPLWAALALDRGAAALGRTALWAALPITSESAASRPRRLLSPRILSVRSLPVLVAMALLAFSGQNLVTNYRNGGRAVPFTVDDFAQAERIAALLPPETLVANLWDDGSTWAMHVSERPFLLPCAWDLHASDGQSLHQLVRGLADHPWSEETARLVREHAIGFLYVSDGVWRKGSGLRRSDFAGDPRFEPVIVGTRSTLYRIQAP